MFRHWDVFGPNGIHTLSSPPSSRLECFHCRVSRTGQQSQISNRQNQTQTVKFSFWCVGGYWNNPGELVHAQKRKKKHSTELQHCHAVPQHHSCIVRIWLIFMHLLLLLFFVIIYFHRLLTFITSDFKSFSFFFLSCSILVDVVHLTLWQITT